METYYKLTDKNGYTRKGKSNETLWSEGVRHDATGKNKELCSNGFIHAYESPEMAIFMNPAQGRYDSNTMLLWECHLHGKVKIEGQFMCGAKGCTTIRKISLPVITTEQRITIAVKIALCIYKKDEFVKWANNWLSGKDRSSEAAYTAVAMAYAINMTNVANAVHAAAFAAFAADTVNTAAYMAADSVAYAAGAANEADIDILTAIKETIYPK